MLAWIDNWISQTDTAGTYRREHFWVLVALIVIGTVLRFWGLGNVGLHGDEETMAMPTMSILENGMPFLPSGMFYPRAVGQLYLMAASVSVFGESEWAFRFPSAVVGSLAGLVAFFLGRRFLSPNYNLLFVAVITFLPYMIEISQMARMYVFFVTSLMFFGVLMFRWEQDGRLTSLTLTFFAWLLALHFHTLSIFAAPFFLYPGLTRKSIRQLIGGGIAMALAYMAFRFQRQAIGSQYPSRADSLQDAEPTVEPVLSEASLANIELLDAISVIGVTGGIFLIAILAFYGRSAKRNMLIPALFLSAGITVCSFLHYHVGAIMLLAGAITWSRASGKYLGRLSVILAAVFLLAAVQIFLLHGTGEFPGRRLIGAIVGSPSVWPTLRFAEYSPGAIVLFAPAVVFAAFRLSKNQPIPDFFLLFSIAVWAPLFAIGFFSWYVPPRYTLGALPFFLLCCVAGLSYMVTNSPCITAVLKRRGLSLALSVAAVLAIVNPAALSEAVNVDYSTRPDHKGAAEFVKGLPLRPNDIVIAEDVLQQRYYLGRVDYWLLNIDVARKFAFIDGDNLLDQYTGSKVIGSGFDFVQVLDQNRSDDVYIVGSGENFSNRRQHMRGNGIGEVLNSDRLELIFRGRDGNTVVWRLRK